LFKYIDIASYQAGLKLDGAEFVMIKATEGISYVDPYYVGWVNECKSKGIPYGAYHYMDASMDPYEQADHCMKVVQDPQAPIMLDVEVQEVRAADITDFMGRLEQQGFNPRLLYYPRWLQQDTGIALWPFVARGWLIVSSAYVNAYSDSGVGWEVYGEVTPSVWQYSSSYLFNGQRVDVNAYKGTKEEFLNLMGVNGMSEIKYHEGTKVEPDTTVLADLGDLRDLLFTKPSELAAQKLPAIPEGSVLDLLLKGAQSQSASAVDIAAELIKQLGPKTS
jgi:GH25 family lysozyme M1 (1,4-beta-N-acetylmuramidase)